MATKDTNLSNIDDIGFAGNFEFGLVISEWNEEVTENLKEGALEVLKEAGVKDDNIHISYVPGSFELPLGSQFMIEQNSPDAVIAIGSLIRGETSHFDVIAHSVSKGIQDVNLKHNLPVIFCVLTDENMDQARARSGGKNGNKGKEAAVSGIKMVRKGDY